MKLSDISTLVLSPGTYTIVAAFDGDDRFNAVQAQYILTVNAVASTSRRGRSVTDDNEDGQKPVIVKRDPDFYFSPSTVYFNESETGSYVFNFTEYIVNNDGVGYNISLSEGLYLETNGNVSWYDSGTYTITLTSNSTEVFNSKIITMKLNVVSKVNPQIEYRNDGTYILQDGVLVKKYYNIEQRDGVYKFDLMQPSNPYSLPLEYKIEGNANCYIDVDNNKVYVSREGRYKITATFAGDNTYRPSITSYVLSYYENQENEDNDDQGTYIIKQSPNLSFSSNTINIPLSGNGTYTGQSVNNPYGVAGIWTTSNNANITSDGTIITLNGIGNVIVYYTFYGDEYYDSQTVSYVLHVYVQENPDNKPVPDIYFPNNMVTVVENEDHDYHIQQVINPDAVNVNYYCNGEKIENGILHTEYIGNLTIIASTEEDDTFYSASTTYTLTITAYEQSRPQIWFLTDNETANETADHTYLIQLANCNVDVPINYTVSAGSLNDRILSYDGIGTVVITAITEETFYYESVRASYVLNILEVNKLSPGILFKDGWGKATVSYVNQSQSNSYDILPLYNPYNVEVRFYTDRGLVDNETNATKLYMDEEDNKTGTVNIYAQSIENDTYKSEIATYKLNISETITLDLDFDGTTGTQGYSTTVYINASGKLDTPKTVEIVRFPKDPNFIFSPDEWYMSPNGMFSTFNNFIYSEDGNDCVISASITFSSYRTSYYKFKFKGNDKFNETPEINIQITYTNAQQSPEISFPSNIEVIPQTSDYNYVLQNVENPHNVEIVYSSSKGIVTGNILHYEDLYNLIIYATSVETDEYYSQTIRYTLKINKSEKPSRGWHFATSEDDDTPIPVHQNNKYVVRDIVDENGDLVPIEDLTGQFSCSMTSTFEYDDEQGKYIVTLTNPNYMFDYNNGLDWFTINYKLPDTGQYKAETISYRQYISDKPKANIYFIEPTVNLKQVEDGKYALQVLNNPDNHPIIWSIEGAGQFDDANNPEYILISGTSNTWSKITATVEETETVKRTSAQYSLYILKVTQHLSDWTVKWKDDYSTDPTDPNEQYGRVDANDTGIYDLWSMIDIIGGTWEDVDVEISGNNCTLSGNRYLVVSSNPLQDVEIRIWTKETFETLRSLFRLWLLVKYPQQRTLFNRMSYSGELTGEVNEEFDIEFGRWSYQSDFVFKEEEWSYSDQGYGTIKNIYTKTVNEYTVLCATFSTSRLNAYNNGRITFKGNETFYSNYITYEIYVNKKQEPQDTRLTPRISFSNYNVKVSKTTNDQYLLQTLNKPDDCEIDRWEIVSSTYGTPTIIDDAYVYFPIDDTSRQITLKVYTKESDIYKAASDGYTLQVSPITKINSQISFEYSSYTANKNDSHIYDLPQLRNPYDLPVTWSTTLGTIEDGHLVYDGVGTAKITVVFAGDDTYEATSSTCNYWIKNQYDKQYITYQKYGDREVQVIFGQEYSYEILRWPASIGLEFNEEEWRYSSSSLTASLTGLYAVEDGEYIVLMGKYIFDKAGSAYVTTTFNGNDYFYNQKHIADFEIYYTRAADLVSPNISFTESTVTIPYSNTEKYLIQTPTGAAGVTFNEPTTSLGYIEKVNNDYYVVYDGTEGANITISISSVQDSIYYSQTISYTLNVEAKPIEVQDTQISFANPEVTLDYVWEQNKTKRYKVQDLYNPWGLNVTYTITAGNLRQESDGYYIYYDSVGDITINAVGQSNQYYNGSTASYTLHVVSVGEDFSMTFEQPTITVTQTSEGRYLMQQATIVPEVPDIRNNIVYSAVGATIEAAGDDFYVVYNGIGRLTIKALFETDLHYKSKEATYTLVIEENIEIVDPDISISSNNIEIENISEQTRFKVPDVTNNSGVDYSWYIGNTQLVVDANGYFNYNATGDFVIILETVGTQHYNSISLYCNYTNIDYEGQYLTIESIDDNNTIGWFDSNVTVTLEYSTDLINWNSVVSSNEVNGTPIYTLNADEKVYLRGNYYSTLNNYCKFTSTGRFNVSGNIMSLLYGNNFKTNNTMRRFVGLFRGCVYLVSAKHLILPATILPNSCDSCYSHMFEGCTSLVTAPELPARRLARACYYEMFKGCTSLVNAPELPATTLATNCYTSMFERCTSLTTAPELPATTLAYYCYENMFRDCTSLTTVPELPATTLVYGCYYAMFKGCTSLVNAPELQATTLADYCYAWMFNDCTSLNSIKCLATNISASYCTNNWVKNVSSTGTFVKKSGVEWSTGESGIPQGWTVVNI